MRRSSSSSPAGLWILAVLASGFPAISGFSPGAAQAPDSDCNENGVPDPRELAASDLDFSVSGYHVFDEFATALAVADIDGDSLPDVVLAGQRSKSIRILFGTPAGALAGEVSILLTGEPQAVEIIDIDHDGDPDVAVILQPTSRLALLANDGDGNLANAAETATGAGPHSMAAADFDGDGWTDLAVGASNQFGIFPGRQGGFRDPVTYARPSIIAVAAGSIDGDLLPDLAAGLAASEAAVYLSRGGALEPVGIARTARFPRYLEVADLDGDGSGDLAAGSLVADTLTRASVTRGRGDGTFEEPRILDVLEGMVPVAGADLDLDGTRELLLASGGFLEVRSARGDTWERESSFIAPRAVALEVADLDADGFLDALILSRTQLVIHRGLPGKEFLTDLIVPTLPGAVGLAAADFDGDGEVDLVAGTDETAEEIAFHRGLGGGRFDTSVASPSSHGPRVLEPVDFSADGALDLVVLGWVGGHLGTLENQGGGGFRLAAEVVAPGVRVPALAVLDMDGDGRLDMVVLDRTAKAVSAFPVSTDGTLGPPVLVPTLDDPTFLRAGDITGDGLAEIVVASTTGLVAHPGRGRAGLGPSIPIAERELISGLELADVDEDGFLDLVLSPRDFELEVLRGQAGGAFAPGIATSGPGPHELRVLDVNGDGRLDLAAAHGEEISMSIGSGEGEFGYPHRFFVGRGVSQMVVADFDREGAPDVGALWFTVNGSGISVLLNETEPPAYPDCDGNGVPDACDIRDGSRADVDGNGIPDVCDPDCDGDGAPDALEIASGGAADVDADGVPDPCERDCNANGVPDDHEIASGIAADVDRNLVPDECQSDCNANELPDRFEIDAGLRPDLNGNGLPDECDPDCNRNTVPDDEDLRRHDSRDANRNGIPDECDIESGASEDRNGNGIPDDAEVDCDGSGVPDIIEILEGVAADRNRNRRIDACDIRDGLSRDVDLDGVPDEVQADCDRDGVPDSHEIATGAESDCDADGRPDGCDVSRGRLDLGFPPMLPVRDNPRVIAAADLDLDGLEDILVLDTELQPGPGRPPILDVHSNRGLGGFQRLPPAELPYDYRMPVLLDMDRDGRVDMVALPGSEEAVDLLFGSGDGTFDGPSRIDLRWPPSSFTASDITGDARPDLVLTSASELVLLEGRGDGTFEPARYIDPGPSPARVAAADVNLDGRLDLVVSSSGVLVVLPGEGGGLFGEAIRSESTSRLGKMVVDDFSGDGTPDAVLRSNLGLSVFRGEGNGSFSEVEPIPLIPEDEGPLAVDLDQDGGLDIVLTSWPSGRVSIRKGLGGLAFSEPRDYLAGRAASAAAFLDVDLDRDLDIAALTEAGIAILTQEGGSFLAPPILAFPPEGVLSGVHDLNRDGRRDLIVSLLDAKAVEVLPGNDTGFGPGVRVTTSVSPVYVAAADLDRDGFEDLAVSGPRSEVELLMGDAGGGFRHAGTLPVTSLHFGIRFADFTDDGFPDLLSMTLSSILIFRGAGDGSFAPPEPVPDRLGGRAFVIEDFDSDGHLDLGYAQPALTTLSLIFGDGNGRFPRSRSVRVGPEPAEALVAADLDGDGVLDLAAALMNADAVSVLRGTGRGFFAAAKLFPVAAPGPFSIVTLDLDRDGILDLVTSDFAQSSREGLSILFGAGGGEFESAFAIPGSSPVVFDLPDTGGMDLLMPVSDPGGVILLANRTQPADDPDCDGNGVPDSCDLAVGPSADCDGNGVLDRCEDPPSEGPCAPAGCRVPGDCNEDGRTDMADGLCILGYKFLGSPQRLPCGPGSSTDASNLELLDWQPDGSIDISDAIALFSYLHLGAPPHVRAVPGSETTACVPVQGCSEL